MLTTPEFVRALNADDGVSVGETTTSKWSRQHPGLTVRYDGRELWREEVIHLLLAGVPLDEIPARLQVVDNMTSPVSLAPGDDR